MASSSTLSLCLVAVFFLSSVAADGEYYIYNITAELERGRAYATLIGLLSTTGMATTINMELNNTFQRITFFAPTDGAFAALPTGFLGNLTVDQQTKLINYHVLSKLVAWQDFKNLTGPQQTQASGQNGPYFLNFVYVGPQQELVTTGAVNTTFTNALNTTPPAAIYQLDAVLLPEDKFAPNNAPSSAPSSSPASKPAPSSSSAPKSSPPSASQAAEGSTKPDHNSATPIDVSGGVWSFIALTCVALML